MNKIGLHQGYWRQTPAEHAGIERWLELTKQTTCEVFEIGPSIILPMSKQERADFKKLIADNGMTLSINGGYTPSNDIASDDPAIRKIGVEYGKSVLEAMADVGCDRWSGINYSAWLRRPDCEILTYDEKQRIRELSLESMKQIIKTAEDCGVKYCFEIVNRFEQVLLNTSAEGVAFCEEIGSPNAQLLLDTFHMNIEEDSIVDALEYAQTRGRLGHVHVGESNRRVPNFDGKTHLDWDGILGILKKTGYEGFITMEPFMKMGLTTICVWRDLSHDADVDQMVVYARDAANFLRGKLA